MNENEEILKLFKKLIKEEQEKYEKTLKDFEYQTKPYYMAFREYNNASPYDRGIYEYYKNHKNEIIFGHVCRNFITFLNEFRTHFVCAYKKNDLNFEKYYKLEMENPFSSDFVKLMGGGSAWLNGNKLESETYRRLITQLFPTGKEKEVNEYFSTQDKYAATDKFLTAIFDKVLGKGNYQYRSREEQNKVQDELENPNLTLQQWVELQAKNTLLFQYHGGVLDQYNAHLFEKYLNNPEEFEYDYKQWKMNIQLKNNPGKSR